MTDKDERATDLREVTGVVGRGDSASLSPLPSPSRLPALALESKFAFHYKGDLFSQHGVYTDASLYLSRLPSAGRSAMRSARKTQTPTKLQPMTPMTQQRQQQAGAEPQQQQHNEHLSRRLSKSSKTKRKRQYAAAIESMAANPMLHATLLGDMVVDTLLSLGHTTDLLVLGACVSTLCHLSTQAIGRRALLDHHNALPFLLALAPALSHDKRMLHSLLALLANLTIEDGFESLLVKEKALDCVMKHRKASPLAEYICSRALFHLSCLPYSYPRVDDAIRALAEHARDATSKQDALVAKALFNFSATRMNQLKLVEADAVGVYRALLQRSVDGDGDSEADEDSHVGLHVLMSLWNLSENANCRKAISRTDCLQALVEQLTVAATATDTYARSRLRCVLATLLNMAHEDAACRLMGELQLLEVLARLAIDCTNKPSEAPLVPGILRLLAIALSVPVNVGAVGAAVFEFLVSFSHGEQIQADADADADADAAPDDATSSGSGILGGLGLGSGSRAQSRYVLFSLACVLSWIENEETTATSLSKPRAAMRASLDDRLDKLLDNATHLARIYAHVQLDAFPPNTPEVFFQALLLYNLSFRYNKVEVARRASTRLRSLALANTHTHILALVAGTLFSLCQEYETHLILHAAEVIDTLGHLAATCDRDAQAMCLEIVCIIFDGRQIGRTALAQCADRLSPVLVRLCRSGSLEVRSACAASFARFAMIDECRPVVVRQGVLASLAILANAEDPPTLRLCVFAFAHLSRDVAIGQQLIESGVLESLTVLAAAPEEAVRRACAMTLCNLSHAESNIAALVARGALRAILVISCVKSNDQETRRICVKAMMNLLRVPSAIAKMCRDGLLWAFSHFTSSMESKDHDMLSDAFWALSCHPETRSGILAPSVLATLLPILEMRDAAIDKIKVKLLQGLANVLCDLDNATNLVRAGLLVVLIGIAGTAIDGDAPLQSSPQPQPQVDSEVAALVATLLVLIFQSCPDAEIEFVQSAMVDAIRRLLAGSVQDDTTRTCSLLLCQMSLRETPRRAIAMDPPLLIALFSRFSRCSSDAQLLLLRVLFNISSDVLLTKRLPADEVVKLLWLLIEKSRAALVLPSEIAAIAAGLLRNLSCESHTHVHLTTEPATLVLTTLFAAENAASKEDAAVCLCNTLLGHINTSALLSRSTLPLVLWLCDHANVENRALATAVVRKLALAPGNASVLVDGGVISHLALVTHEGGSLFVQTNCIATFCLLSTIVGVPALVASYGIIGSVLDLLQGGLVHDPLLVAMCLDLLSTLAEFSRADDPREGKLSSTLFDLMENDPSVAAATHNSSAWQLDRAFLSRDEHGPLRPPTHSSAHQTLALKDPLLRSTVRPIRLVGYSVDFSLTVNHIDARTIEPIAPPLSALGEDVAATPTDLVVAASMPDSASSGGDTESEVSSPGKLGPVFVPPVVPARIEITPLAMFPKLGEAFAATSSALLVSSSHNQTTGTDPTSDSSHSL